MSQALLYIGIGVAMSFGGFLVARLHLHLMDRLYLWYGRHKRFPAPR